MAGNVLFVDMTLPFLPVMGAVQKAGFDPVVMGRFAQRVRRAGINCRDLYAFAPEGLEKRVERRTLEISRGLRDSLNGTDAKELLGPTLGKFIDYTGPAFFNRFIEIAKSEIETVLCFEAFLKNHMLDIIVLRTEKMAYERTLIQLARQHRIPTLHVAHAIWPNVGKGTIAGEYGRGVDSEYVSVFGQRAHEGMRHSGIAPEKVFITGSPYWDELYLERSQISRAEACRRLKLDPERPVILFCTGYAHANRPAYPQHYKALLQDHNTVLRALEEVHPQCQLIVRHHPSELNEADTPQEIKEAAVRAYNNWVKHRGAHQVIINNAQKIESFRAADAVIIFGGSNVIVDSMILRRPVIALRSGGAFGTQDGILVAKNPKDLPHMLKEVVTVSGRKSEIIQNQNRALPDLNYNNDGRAKERLAELIVRLAKDSQNRRGGKTLSRHRSKVEQEMTANQSSKDTEAILATGLIPTRRAVIDINRPCNAKCVMCYHAYEPDNWSKPVGDVTQELFDAKRRGNTSVDFTGGEPTIFPNMPEIIAYAESLGLHTCIITNGLALDKIKKITESGCSEWLLSIHGYREQQDRILGVKGAWQKMNDCVHYLQSEGCKIRVNCTLTKYNYQDLPLLAKYYADEVQPAMVNFINFNPHYKWGDQGQPEIYRRLNEVQIRTSEAAPYLEEALSVLNEQRIWANVRYFPFCVLKGFETHICNNPQVMFDPYEWDYDIAPKSVDIYQAYGRSLQEKIGFKGNPCRQCGILNVCGGVHKNYEQFHGASELAPYKDPSDYPYHFKTDVEADIIVPVYTPNENVNRLLSEIAEKAAPPYNIILVNHRQSAARNRNYGMERSRSPYVIMCDDDLKDLPFAWNRKLINLLKENSHLLAVSARLMNEDGTPGKNTANNYDMKTHLVPVNMIPTACAVFRKTHVRFDERFIRAGWEDTDFFRQLEEKHPLEFAISNEVRVVHLNEEKEAGGAGNIHNQHLYFEKWREQAPGAGTDNGNLNEPAKAAPLYREFEKLMDEKRETEAFQKLENLVATCPNFAPGRNQMGQWEMKKGNMETALKHFLAATEQESMNPDYLKDLAELYRSLPGKLEEAMKCYIKVLAIHPTHAETLLSMGQVCREVNKRNEAAYFFGRVLEIEPWNTIARENLDQLSN